MAKSPFQHSLKHYCGVYNVSYRQILRYKEDGFPLDDIEQTKQLLASGVKPSQLRTDAPRTALPASAGRQGLEASIQRLEAAEESAHSEFEAARTNGDEQTAELRQKQWLRISEQLRRVAQSSPDIEEANKNTVRIEEVGAALNDLFLKLRQDLDSMPRRIALEVIGKDELAARAVIKRETDEIISSLYVCKYLEGGESE